MAASLGDLVVSIAGDIAKLELSMSRAERLVAQTADKIDSFAAKANTALAGIGASLVGLAAIQKLGDSIEGAIDKAAGLEEMAKRTATSAEELSKLSIIAKQSNTDMDLVAKSVQVMSRAMLDTAAGTGKARDSLASLGLSVKDSNGQLKNGVDFLQEFAKKTADMSNETQRLGILQKVLKGSGAELSQFLYELADAGQLNAKVTNQQAFEAEQYEKAIRSLTAAKAGLYNTIAQQVTPVLTALTRTYTDLITGTDSLGSKTKELAQQNKIREWATDAGIAIAMVVDGFRYVALGIKIAGDAIVAVGMVFIGAFDIIGKLIGTLNASLADMGQVLEGIGLIMSGKFELGVSVISGALDRLKAGWKGFGDDVKGDMTALGRELLAVGDDIDGMLDSFKQSKTVDLFLDQLSQVQQEMDKVRKTTGDTTDITKAFKKDGIEGLTASLAKNAALYVQQITDLQTFGKETKATTVSTTAAVLSEMAHSGALAEHAKRTGESEAATRKRVLGLADLNDKLLEIIETEKAHIAALLAEHNATMSDVDRLTELRDQFTTYGMLADAVTRFHIARLQEKLDAISLFDKEGDLTRELRDRIAVLNDIAASQKRLADLHDTIQAWTQVGDIIGNTAKMAITDWGGAVKYLRDQMKQLLLDMVAIFAKRWFLSMVADMTGNSALGLAAAATGNGTAAGSLVNYASSALSASRYGSSIMGYFGGSSGLSSAQGVAGIDALEAGGTSQGIQGAYGAASQTSSFGTALNGALPIISYFAIAIAGAAVAASQYAQGWRINGNMGQDYRTNNPTNPLFTASAMDRTYRALGINDQWAAILSGSSLATRMFGRRQRQNDAYGVEGTFSGASQFSGNNYQDWSRQGGWFSSTQRGTDPSAFSTDQASFFSSFTTALAGTMTWLGNALHVDAAQVLANYSHAFQIQLSDNGNPLPDDQVHALFANLFGTVLQEQVAQMLTAGNRTQLAAYITGLQGTGDEITAAINSFLGVFQGTMVAGLNNFTVESVMAMERSGETLGDTFTRMMTDWSKLQDAFTPQSVKIEQAKFDLGELYTSLTQFGYSVPTTREGWLAVMRSLDMSTASGQELFDRMMALAPAFDAVSNAAASMMSSFDQIMGRMRPGYTSQMAQMQNQSDIGTFMSNNPWTSGMSPEQVMGQILTISRDDFSHYSVANQQLILSILGFSEGMNQTTQTLSQVNGQLQQNYQQLVDKGQSSASSLTGSLGNVFTGDFATRVPALIKTISGEIARLDDAMNQPGAVGTQEWIANQSKMSALMTFKNMQQMDLNRYYELEGQAPGHGEALLGLEKWFADSKALVAGNVPGMLALEEEFQRRRADIMKSGGDSANSGLSDQLQKWWRGLFFDQTLSPISLQDQFTQAKAQYETTLSLAQSGDASSMGDLQGDAQQYLNLARQLYASSADYTAIFRTVAAQTGPIAGVSAAEVNAKLGLSLPDGKLASSTDIQALASQVQQTLVATASDPLMIQKLDQILDALNKLKQNGVLA